MAFVGDNYIWLHVTPASQVRDKGCDQTKDMAETAKTVLFLLNYYAYSYSNKHCQTTQSIYGIQATCPVCFGGAVITTQQRARYNKRT
jgi:hypothetical protein